MIPIRDLSEMFHRPLKSAAAFGIRAAMRLCRIEIFPIKSLDGIALETARITPGGILEKDRVFAIKDADGKVVNGKRTARVHQLRCAFDPGINEVRLWQGSESPVQFPLDDPGSMSGWLSDFFGFPVGLHHEAEKGFPDDREAFGPTIVSEASLAAIRQWFPELTLESIRRRFRANLELDVQVSVLTFDTFPVSTFSPHF